MITPQLFRNLEPMLKRLLRRQPKVHVGTVPHTQLRLALESDPSMEALLPAFAGSFAIGDERDAPFRVRPGGLVLLGPQLIHEPAALAAAARWGMEARERAHTEAEDVLRHGLALLALLPEKARQTLKRYLPEQVDVDWLASRMSGLKAKQIQASSGELALPVESLLLNGGDSRLVLDPSTGLNRYGVCPRPRPEAVHFSSSTASAISEHGFWLCELWRREKPELREMVQKISAELLRLLGLSEEEADVILSPSGTDTEHLAVLMALAKDEPGKPLTNLLIAPDESGKGVRMAGGGLYFDGPQKGSRVWSDQEITIVEIPIRDGSCRVCEVREVDAKASAALKSGTQLLVHLLHVSKTGLSAPSLEWMKQLPGEADVVVDACQMRTAPRELGDMVRLGWMVQVSGSKFYTGPPFSGALVIPRNMRARVESVARLLAAAPQVSHPVNWGEWWSERLPQPTWQPSVGPLFRWLPALAEAELYSQTDATVRDWAFERFRSEVTDRFASSPFLKPIADEVAGSDFAKLSIMAFQVIGNGRALREKECTWLFEHLNKDISSILPDLSETERTLASLPCHIGQPVVLSENLAFLRLVLGARFFNAVCHTEHREAALACEIADAKRVLAKIDWMASRWPDLEKHLS